MLGQPPSEKKKILIRARLYVGHTMPKLRIGDPAPDFTLRAHDGSTVVLSEQRGRNVVLFFYPKDETIGCIRENCHLRDNIELFRQAGTAVYGVSVGSVDSHRKFAEHHRLPQQLLSDDGTVSRAYNALGMFSFLRKRITYVIDKEGRIRHIYASPLPNRHVDEALVALRRLAVEAGEAGRDK